MEEKMKIFRSYLVMAFQRLFIGRNAIVMVLFFILSMYFVYDGVNRYRESLENAKNFTRIERLKVEKYQYYTQYGMNGFRVLFVPSPLGIFSSNYFPSWQQVST